MFHMIDEEGPPRSAPRAELEEDDDMYDEDADLGAYCCEGAVVMPHSEVGVLTTNRPLLTLPSAKNNNTALVRVSTYTSSLNQATLTRYLLEQSVRLVPLKRSFITQYPRSIKPDFLCKMSVVVDMAAAEPLARNESTASRSPVDSLLLEGDDRHHLLHHRPGDRPLVMAYSSTITRTTTASKRSRKGRPTKMRRRVVFKSGECNVLQSRVAQRRLRYLQDIFTTLVDTQWRWTLLVFALSFILSWLGFALIWWLIAFTHADLEPEHLPDKQEESGWTPCVMNIYTFASCFLFSIETQHTIGYGSRFTTEECPEAIFVMCLQSITGVMIQAFMVGIVFAKMSRPKQRAQTLLFSRNAVVCLRDGDLCLMFRVGDMRKSHIIGATVRAQLIKTRTTKEGEVLYQHQAELKVGTDKEGDNSLFFIWPMTVVHKIDQDSPLYNTSASDIIDRESRFEIVVILEGTIESTGQTTQARSSYLPNEILWGHRFQPMVMYNKERQGYEVDYSRFNNTDLVDTPLCSARDLERFYQLQQDLNPPHVAVGRHLSDTVSSLYSAPASLIHVPTSVISSSPASSPRSSPQLNTQRYWNPDT